MNKVFNHNYDIDDTFSRGSANCMKNKLTLTQLLSFFDVQKNGLRRFAFLLQNAILFDKRDRKIESLHGSNQQIDLVLKRF